MKWRAVSALTSMVQRGDRALVLYVAPSDGTTWTVAAFETHSPDLSGSSVEAIRSALEDHAHAQLDPVPSLEEALALAEKYAHWWRSSRASHFVCGCEEIPPAIEAGKSPACPQPKVNGE